MNKRFVLEELLGILKKHSNYLFLRDFDITEEFSQVGVIINFKNSKVVKEAGANILVSGSTIFNENEGDLKKNINLLREN